MSMRLDPVCTMDIAPETAEAKSEYEGETIYFCSDECKRIFDADPETYLDEIEIAEDRTPQES